MTWKRVVVGGVDLRETWTADQDGATVTISGQESSPPSTLGYVEAMHANVTALAEGSIVPVTFGDKDVLTGFYRVRNRTSKLSDYANESVVTADWSMTLERIGSERDVEVESVVPSQPSMARASATSGMPAAVFWHAPAVGTTSYLTGPTVPAASFTRASADGAVPVNLGIPAGVAPRWTVSAAQYLAGAARILLDGIRRAGLGTPPHTTWEAHNGIVRVRPHTDPAKPGEFVVETWSAATQAWVSARGHLLVINGGNVNTKPEVTVIRNDPEEVVIRLSYAQTTGRVTIDLGVRRGARVVTGVAKRHSAADLALQVDHGEAHAAVTGGIRASTADASGNRLVVGSVTGSSGAGTPGNVFRLATRSLDFFVGHEVGGAVAGDLYTDLLAQYRGHTGERARVVQR